jgi:hypothetical protein
VILFGGPGRHRRHMGVGRDQLDPAKPDRLLNLSKYGRE